MYDPMLRRFLVSTAFASIVALATQAHADCALGSNYRVLVDAKNTVTIGLDATSRKCPDASGMLRQNIATGEVDLLGSFCGTGSFGDSTYIDECVAPGTYRYGLALPFDCSQAGCGGVDVFKEVTVTTALPASCMRSAGDPGPTVTNEMPPWGTGAEVESFKSCPHAGCACEATSTTVLSMNGIALGAGALAMLVARRRRKA